MFSWIFLRFSGVAKSRHFSLKSPLLYRLSYNLKASFRPVICRVFLWIPAFGTSRPLPARRWVGHASKAQDSPNGVWRRFPKSAWQRPSLHAKSTLSFDRPKGTTRKPRPDLPLTPPTPELGAKMDMAVVSDPFAESDVAANRVEPTPDFAVVDRGQLASHQLM